MNLPTPRLDDRTFQDLVDEAKRNIARRSPQWTNHNVSDPGITLVETFAWMTELLLYRVNRVPERLHVAFLDLVGVQLYPPSAARTEVSFRLSSHHGDVVRIPAGTVVSTRRTVAQDAVGFTTLRDLDISPGASRTVLTMPAGGEATDRTSGLGLGDGFLAFSSTPGVNDALYLGLDHPAPSNLVLVQVVCSIGGFGIDPRHPPLVWEAWTPDGWEPCELERDDTLGLNVSGGIEIHVPPGHDESNVAGISAAWLRCRVVPVARPYRSSPVLVSVTAATIGGDVEAVNAERVLDETLGTSDGTTGQVMHVAYPPVVLDADEAFVVDVVSAPGAQTPWIAVDDFAASSPDDPHVVLDRSTGEVRFGPAVRLEDGSERRFGAIPPRGSTLRVRQYRTGGGAGGNVAARAIAVLRTSIPYVASVYNRRAAAGGVDGETVENARRRGPLELRSRGRAVTAEDYVDIVRRTAPELARVHCVPVTEGADAGSVRVLAIPAVQPSDGPTALRDLQLPDSARDRVLRALDETRVVGVRISVEPPSYVGIRIDARVRARPDSEPAELERACLTALYRYYDPLTGGPDGTGWPLGRPVQPGEVHGVLGRVPGLDFVEAVVLCRANPLDGSISAPQDRIDLDDTHVVLSVEHSVVVDQAV
ncbi:putative baseplate assembly protein [Cellulomonas sp. URHD0024]|uniref:putative baseplate assembly protein n=1 Tax=Cellulomonas sp. URHD0024 TaxID=1302620 RepID=UPI00041C94B3|nr:putative baseplate assembly protein [Cellulomonas sp. URHD0024]